MKYLSVTEQNRCGKCEAIDKPWSACSATESKPLKSWAFDAAIIGYEIL